MNNLDQCSEGKGIIVLIHGLGADASSWVFQLQALCQAGYRPIAVDLPGFGKTPHHGAHWTIRGVAYLIRKFLQECTDEKVIVIGHSLGGTIAQQMVIDYPEIVAGLVLVNTFAHLRPHHASEWIYLLRRGLITTFRGPAAQAELVARRVFPHSQQEWLREETVKRILAADPIVYRSAMMELVRFDSRKQLGALKMPVLVIRGDQDTTIRLEDQEDLIREIPQARNITIPGAGHAVMVDQPANVNQSLLEFLDTIPGWQHE